MPVCVSLHKCPDCGWNMARSSGPCSRCGWTQPQPQPQPATTPAVPTRRPDGSTSTVRGKIALTPLQAQNSTNSAGCMVAIGVVLCLSGVGAILGLPLLVMGWLQSNNAANNVASARGGACPYCGGEVWLTADRANCHQCGQLIILRNNRLWQANG